MADNFDAAVRISRLRDSMLVARQIAKVELIVVASATYLKRRGTPKAPRDVTSHECLVYTGAKQFQTWQFQLGKRRITHSPAGRFHADNGEALIQAAKAGLGVAALPDFIVSESIKAGLLVKLFSDYKLQEGTVHVLRPPGTAVPAKTRALIDLMVEFFDR